MSKNTSLIAATLMLASGLHTYTGTIEAYGKDSITMAYKKKRSSKYRRQVFSMDKVHAYGKDKKTGEDFVTVLGSGEYREFVGELDKVENGFATIMTESGKVHVRTASAEIVSAEDFDGEPKKKKKKSEDGKKKKKKAK
jgi:hypothetical protein